MTYVDCTVMPRLTNTSTRLFKENWRWKKRKIELIKNTLAKVSNINDVIYILTLFDPLPSSQSLILSHI